MRLTTPKINKTSKKLSFYQKYSHVHAGKREPRHEKVSIDVDTDQKLK